MKVAIIPIVIGAFVTVTKGLLKGLEDLEVSRLLYCHLQHHNNTIIKTHAGRLLNKYMYLSLYCKGSKRLLKVCVWEGAGHRTETAIFWPSLLWPSTLCLSRSPDAQPEGLGSTLLGDGFLYRILSATSLVPKLHRVPEGPFGRAWLSLPHLVYLCLQLYCNWHWDSNSTELYNSSRPLDLWNRVFNRHHAEITVMLFRGHSLPVCQSMSAPWEFFSSSYFICQFPATRFPLITAIGMCHFLPVLHLGMAFLAGSKGQNITRRVETVHPLLRTARILRRVQETWGDLLSLELQWKTIS